MDETYTQPNLSGYSYPLSSLCTRRTGKTRSQIALSEYAVWKPVYDRVMAQQPVSFSIGVYEQATGKSKYAEEIIPQGVIPQPLYYQPSNCGKSMPTDWWMERFEQLKTPLVRYESNPSPPSLLDWRNKNG